LFDNKRGELVRFVFEYEHDKLQFVKNEKEIIALENVVLDWYDDYPELPLLTNSFALLRGLYNNYYVAMANNRWNGDLSKFELLSQIVGHLRNLNDVYVRFMEALDSFAPKNELYKKQLVEINKMKKEYSFLPKKFDV